MTDTKLSKSTTSKEGIDFAEEPDDMPAELLNLHSALPNPSVILDHLNLLNYFIAPLYF